MYQLKPVFMGLPAQCITHLSDGASIPADPANTDYAAYLAWTTKCCEVCEGMGVCPDLATHTIKTCPSCKGSKLNTPTPADPVPSPTYQALRAAAYPPVGDQLDAMWKGGEPQATMHETILAVKAEYPKTADAS